MASHIKKARKNIKLLEDADKLAIRKIREPKYKTILTEQKKQLHHYLMQYKDPDYLPKNITKEYEFPKYFYYTINSKKHGVVQKRTRTDSAMFKKFMNNDKKRAMAEAQGLFNKKPKAPKVPKVLKEIKIVQSRVDDEILMDFLDSLVNENRKDKKVKLVKNTPFEELEEYIPSYEPIKKNITINRINRTKTKKTDIHDIILDMTNDYTILGLTRDATEHEIKSAYKKLARKFQQDKTGGDKELTKKFIIVDNAYKRLIDTGVAEDDLQIIEARKFCQSSIENITNRMNNAIMDLNRLQNEYRNEKSAKKKTQLQAQIAENIELISSFDSLLKDLKSELSKL